VLSNSLCPQADLPSRGQPKGPGDHWPCPASWGLQLGSYRSTVGKNYRETPGRGMRVGTEVGHAAILPPAWGRCST